MTLHFFLNYIVLSVLSIAIMLVVYRFIKGPHLSDRVISVDIIFVIGTAICSVFSMLSNEYLFLDIAMLFCLIGFLSTTAFAYYLLKRSKK